MRARGVLLLAGAAALLLGGSAEAAGRHRGRHHEEADDAVDFMPPPPPPGMFPGMGAAPAAAGDGADMFRFAEAGAGAAPENGILSFTDLLSGASTTADVAKSIYDVLSVNRDKNVEATTRVMTQMVENKRKEKELADQQDELKKKAAMLLRLQYCLEQDSVNVAAGSTAAPGAAQGAAGAAQNNQQQQQQNQNQQQGQNQQGNVLSVDEAKKRTEAVLAAEASLAAREKAVQKREAEVSQRLQTVESRITELQKKDAELTARASDSNAGRPAVQGGGLRGPQGPLVCPGTCAANRDCGSCTSNRDCGWCRSSQTCQDLSADGRGGANCSASDWNHLFCGADACEAHLDCRSCLADPECGHCASTQKCVKGSLTGPAQGRCTNWAFASGVPIRVFSLNVYGRDQSNVTGRAPTIFKMIREANADIVMLQEVEDWFLDFLAREAWAKNYHASDFGSGHAPGGLLILTKWAISSVAYYEKTQPGQVEVDQRGRLLVVKPKLGEQNFAIANTALDWRSGENRADSLDFIYSVLNSTAEVVLGGDFNFDAGSQPETSHLPDNFVDVWSALRPKQPGFTWDPTTNRYARTSDPRSRPSRIDRLFVQKGFNKLDKIDKIGCDEASPHYALLAELEMYGAFC